MKEKGARIPRTSMDFYRGLFVGIISIILIAFLFVFISKLLTQKQVPQKQIPQKVSPEISRGKIAIIIDDNGYRSDSCQYINSIPQPVAISILPFLPYSKTVAACAHNKHKEVMLHLPLEPKVYTETYPSGYIITASMSQAVMARKLSDAIGSIPHVVGINNHMGSKATEDTRTMTFILTKLKDKNLFFIDSRVSTKSVAPSVAKKTGVLFGERDVFLDNKANRNYIEGQFLELRQTAEKKGYAIGIGHARPLTWKILKEQLSLLENRGFQLVTVEEIIRLKPGMKK